MCAELPPVNHMHSLITPLIKQGIILQNYAFLYYYRHIFVLTVTENNLVVVKRRPWNWKLIPWLLSLLIITAAAGWGSCVYVCICQLLNRQWKPWVHISPFNTLIFSALFTAASAEFITCIILLLNPHLFQGFNELFKLEHRCKLTKHLKFKLFLK